MYISSSVPLLTIRAQSLWLLGDLHLDEETFDSEAFQKAVKIIGKDPVIFMGDVFDYGFFENVYSQLTRRLEKPYSHMFEAARIFSNLNIVAVCEGNHDVRGAKKTGELFLRYLAEDKNIAYAEGQMVIQVHAGKKRNGRPKYYRIAITHGSRSGRRQSSVALELEDFARIWSGVDVVAVGHHHRFMHTTITKNVYITGKVYTEVIEAVAVPAFLGYAIYAQKRLYPPPEPALVKITFENGVHIKKVLLKEAKA